MPDRDVSIAAPASGTATARPPGGSTAPKPLVLVPACNRSWNGHPVHFAGRKYLDAVRLAGCRPVIVPGATPDEIEELLALADGLLLTGSPSNVHPSHFGQEVLDPSLPLDPERDAWTLPLIRAALAGGVPVFAICRGLQEMNVALGGSLHQAVQRVPGRFDHREPRSTDIAVQYGEAHEVAVEPGGRLAGLVTQERFTVNSLHGQGVDRLAPGLRVEALAPDGQIEAFSVPDAAGFNLALQWHPEWRAEENPVSMRMLDAFGDACRVRRDTKRMRTA